MNKAKGSKIFKGQNIRNFKGVFKRHFGTSERLRKMQKSGIVNEDDKRLLVTVTLPQGVYTNTTRLKESAKLKKIIKQIKETKKIVY